MIAHPGSPVDELPNLAGPYESRFGHGYSVRSVICSHGGTSGCTGTTSVTGSRWENYVASDAGPQFARDSTTSAT